MDKLELKHLAPYLPYGLSIMSGETEKILTLHDNYTNNYQVCFTTVLSSTYTKPILRPLSDLDKLGVGGMSEHKINKMIEDNFNLDYGIFCHYKGELSFDLDGDSYVQYDQNKTISFEVVDFVRTELLKAHYDIFGLIDKGLAIDTNTI